MTKPPPAIPPAKKSLPWLHSATLGLALLLNVIFLARWTQRMETATTHVADGLIQHAQEQNLHMPETIKAQTFIGRQEWEAIQKARTVELGDIKALIREQSTKIDRLYTARFSNP